jgi:membrane associated rhomboid family serine protease
MKNVHGVQDYVTPPGINAPPGFPFPCPNSTTNNPMSPSNQCSLSELCGLGGVPNPLWLGAGGLKQEPQPNQWFRFITPIFLHAGFVHIGFNLLLQLTMGREIEVAIGSIRFFLVYLSAGIFGFVFGGNFAASGISSTGASGSLFGIIAITLLDLLYSWNERRNPGRELLFIVIEIVISFVLGLLPGLDNFSHIGGFIVGLCLGISVLHSPNFLRRRIGEDHFSGPSYSSVGGAAITSVAFPSFYRNPVGFFKGRKPLWWAWWLLRAGFLVLVIVIFIVLLNNFYANQNNCHWCKYLSCIVSLFFVFYFS